jgi:hypothetical protein
MKIFLPPGPIKFRQRISAPRLGGVCSITAEDTQEDFVHWSVQKDKSFLSFIWMISGYKPDRVFPSNSGGYTTLNLIH